MTTGGGDEAVSPIDGPDRLDPREEECRSLSGRLAQAERELRALRAQLEVKDEYIATFEEEMALVREQRAETLEHLRSKTSYIGSLPSVRLKVWLHSRLDRLRR
jgi:chromosome segregation ATPase